MTDHKVHSELGASVAARWMACPGSVALSRGQPNYETEHSKAGTAAHALAEKCLLDPKAQPRSFIGTTISGVEVDDDMAEAVAVYVDYCRTLMKFPGAKWWIEKKFSLASLNPPAPMYGTSDFPIYIPSLRQLHVVDYKNGSGVVVEAKGNKQLRYYGLGAVLALQEELGPLDIDEVILTIVQPRAAHPEGVVRSDHISYLDLLAFAGELMDAARATLAPDAPLSAGPHCRFCPAAHVCPAQHEAVQALAQVTFEAMPLDVPPEPATLPLPVLADIMSKLPILEEWASQMRAHCQGLLERGEVTPEQLGLKLVAKQARRQWVDEKAVEKWAWDDKGLRPEEIYDQKLKSPAQLEKVLGKKNPIPPGLVVKKSSGVTMVPLSDKREAVSLQAGEVFAQLTSGE